MGILIYYSLQLDGRVCFGSDYLFVGLINLQIDLPLQRIIASMDHRKFYLAKPHGRLGCYNAVTLNMFWSIPHGTVCLYICHCPACLQIRSFSSRPGIRQSSKTDRRLIHVQQ